jgi:hypothetical protein
MRLLRLNLSLMCVAVLAIAAPAQVVSPPPPQTWHADIRYRIEADREGRIRIFRAMMAELSALGFTPDAREDSDLDILDPNADRMPGTISSKNAAALNRVTAVQSVLLRDAAVAIPDDAAKPVQVSIGLAAGLDATSQRLLHEQVIAKLAGLSYRDAIGYDHRGFTRLRGQLPAGRVMDLLKDLRGQPAGVFLPSMPRDAIPAPLKHVNPIRVVTVLPDLEAVILPTPAAAASPKFSADLRNALTDPAFTGKPMRIEAGLVQPIADLKQFRFRLKTLLPNARLEGTVGPMVTFTVTSQKDLEFIASLPDVLALRLPAMARSTVFTGSTSGGDGLANAHIPALHGRGYRGAGASIVIVAAKFDPNQMPADADYVDLTAELSPTLETSPVAAFDDGTVLAKAARAAAPLAKLHLVRIDQAAFHQLFTVAKAVRGDLTLSVAQAARAETLLDEYGILQLRRDLVTSEYTSAMNNLSDDDKPRERREKALAGLVKYQADEAEFRVRYGRMETLRAGLERLRDATIVMNSLTWDDGYPLDGLSELSQFLESQFTPTQTRSSLKQSRTLPVATWVQAASESSWSVWTAPARDSDGNRVVEFTADTAPIAKGLWTRELNAIAQLNADGTATADLPEGAKLHVVVQWREPHDPGLPMGTTPSVAFQLQLLKQYDATGQKVASDEFTLASESVGTPIRLMTTESSAVFEQALDVSLPTGRYALRIVMSGGANNRFAAETRLAEVNPKVVLSYSGGSNGARPIFASYITDRGGVGIAGDSGGAFTVGRADGMGRSLSLLGAGPGQALRAKPDALLAANFDGHTGSGIAAATMAGLAACFAELNVRPAQFAGTTAIAPNGVFSLPLNWVDQIPARSIALPTPRPADAKP